MFSSFLKINAMHTIVKDWVAAVPIPLPVARDKTEGGGLGGTGRLGEGLRLRGAEY
jgi:hypothetical protein